VLAWEIVPLSPGATFERYEIEALVGRGGMGEVYRAKDSRLHRRVALKVLRTDHAAADITEVGGSARLLREARATAALNHPNAVAIYELGEAEGIPYIAMELVQGESLRAHCGHDRVSTETKVGWLVDVARALWAAHKVGLVHRDVKPNNVMVSEEGLVKVLDFGLAKPKLDPSGFETMMGQVLGTPKYMAPEQLEGKPADAASDQFAFGLTAYELLSGVYPGGPLAGSPALLHTIANVPEELALVVAKLMARKPSARYATMEEVAHALRGCVTAVQQHRAASITVRDVRTGTSDAPTRVLTHDPVEDGSGVVDVEVPRNTMPMGSPAASGLAETPSTKTLPLARPMIPSSPGSNPSIDAPRSFVPSSMPNVSGVFQTNNAVVAARETLTRPASAPEITVIPTPRSATIWIIVGIIVALLAVAGGATIALLR